MTTITEARLLAILAQVERCLRSREGYGVRRLFGYYASDPQVKACVDDLSWALAEHDLDRN